MRAYLIVALAAMSLLLAANAGLQRLDAANAKVAQLDADLEQAKEETKNAKAVAAELEISLRAERELQEALQKKQSQLLNHVAMSSALIEVLKRENKELSDWSSNELPDLVKRLRKRPTIASAADYQDWLSSRHRMHADSGQPPQQRQSVK